jgi:hypothetical protein
VVEFVPLGYVPEAVYFFDNYGCHDICWMNLRVNDSAVS